MTPSLSLSWKFTTLAEIHTLADIYTYTLAVGPKMQVSGHQSFLHCKIMIVRNLSKAKKSISGILLLLFRSSVNVSRCSLLR
jgi:hypothetical protein